MNQRQKEAVIQLANTALAEHHKAVKLEAALREAWQLLDEMSKLSSTCREIISAAHKKGVRHV